MREIATLDEWSFPSRRLVSVYLAWCFEQVVHRLPDNVVLRVLQDQAIDIADLSGGRQAVRLAGQPEVLTVDAVILAVGHLDAEPDGRSAEFRTFAVKHGLDYVPPGYSADLDFTHVRPGETVIVRGLGLAFIDLTALLTEGRGGEYREREDGRLEYVPAGHEPVIVVGSRRGVPHHAKPNYRLTGDGPTLPRFLDRDALDAALSEDDGDFARDIEPLASKEIAWS